MSEDDKFPAVNDLLKLTGASLKGSELSKAIRYDDIIKQSSTAYVVLCSTAKGSINYTLEKCHANPTELTITNTDFMRHRITPHDNDGIVELVSDLSQNNIYRIALTNIPWYAIDSMEYRINDELVFSVAAEHHITFDRYIPAGLFTITFVNTGRHTLVFNNIILKNIHIEYKIQTAEFMPFLEPILFPIFAKTTKDLRGMISHLIIPDPPRYASLIYLCVYDVRYIVSTEADPQILDYDSDHLTIDMADINFSRIDVRDVVITFVLEDSTEIDYCGPFLGVANNYRYHAETGTVIGFS